MKNIIECLEARGFVDQVTSPELKEHVRRPVKIYVGFDPTADSLHLGNLFGIVALEWFRRYGHTPVVILGGATGLIGDPSGKSLERPLLDEPILASNVESLRRFFDAIFSGKAILLNNDDWWREMSFIDVLRDVGKLFRIGPMMAKESVRLRLQSEEGMSFTEFSYQLLQGYDFAYLNEKHGVTVQGGGSDQWGNITAGIEFNRKKGGAQLFGLTWPLMTRSDGKKFGKSEEGAVWLSKERLSPYQFYQYLVRIPDADVGKMFRMLTFLELEEIHGIEREMQSSGYVPNRAQKRLAEEVTRFVHGEEGLQAALNVTEGIAPGSDAVLSGEVLERLMRDMPHAELEKSEVIGCKWSDLAARFNLAPSKSEAARLIKNGGAYLNNQRIDDPAYAISPSDLIEGVYLLLSAGKKKRFLLRIAK